MAERHSDAIGIRTAAPSDVSECFEPAELFFINKIFDKFSVFFEILNVVQPCKHRFLSDILFDKLISRVRLIW